jgi:colanic acid biosynthesis glycosyl transferase WcaI
VPQGLTTVLDAAKLLATCPKIVFVLIGDVSAASDLRRHALQHQLTNVMFLPFQPYSIVPDIYATSDVSLVPQAEGTSLFGLPSKIYRIMACGRPVLAVSDATSELAALISGHADCGAVVGPNDPEALAQMIKRAYDDRLWWSSKGARGREFVVEQYSVKKVADAYTALLTRAASER